MTVSSMLSVVFIWFTIQWVLVYGKNATNTARLLPANTHCPREPITAHRGL